MGLFNLRRPLPKNEHGPSFPSSKTGAIHYPFYIKAPLILIGLYLFFYILVLLREILIPFAFSALIAVLLNPVYNRLQRWKVPKVLAISLTILLAILVVAGVLFFLSSQIVQFGEMLPQLKTKSVELLHQLQEWLSSYFWIIDP
jgi:AI-2 transport protein TqsA